MRYQAGTFHSTLIWLPTIWLFPYTFFLLNFPIPFPTYIYTPVPTSLFSTTYLLSFTQNHQWQWPLLHPQVFFWTSCSSFLRSIWEQQQQEFWVKRRTNNSCSSNTTKALFSAAISLSISYGTVASSLPSEPSSPISSPPFPLLQNPQPNHPSPRGGKALKNTTNSSSRHQNPASPSLSVPKSSTRTTPLENHSPPTTSLV